MLTKLRSDGRHLVLGCTFRPRVGMRIEPDGRAISRVLHTWETGLGEGGTKEVHGPDGRTRNVPRNPLRVYTGALGRWSGVVEVE